MSKKILYIHGLGSDANSTTFQTLKQGFLHYEWITDTFDLLDIAATKDKLQTLLFTENIDTIVASSLGAFYALGVENSLAKIVINPCMNPSVELPKLVEEVDTTLFRAFELYNSGLPFTELLLDNEMRFCTYGIFSTDDELFSCLPDFKRLYGNRYIEVKGGHRLKGQALLSSVQSGFNYFEELNRKLRMH
ncbi:MAG: hypothetical protein IJX65_05095 [Alistipes sp.]|nr:hypothetical protein [Alistipes sp.]